MFLFAVGGELPLYTRFVCISMNWKLGVFAGIVAGGMWSLKGESIGNISLPMEQRFIAVLAVLGAFISLYIIHVEDELFRDAGYVPMCNINSLGTKCSSVLTSDAAHLLSFLRLVKPDSWLDLSNGVSGLMFYQLIFVLTCLGGAAPPVWFVGLGAAGIFVALVLFFVMTVQLHELCLVCTALQVINVILFATSLNWWNRKRR